jgi:hypothetical integral membrane protein (TIGR02206 family)
MDEHQPSVEQCEAEVPARTRKETRGACQLRLVLPSAAIASAAVLKEVPLDQLAPEHIAVLIATSLLCAVVVLVARRWPGRWLVPAGRGFAVLLAGLWIAEEVANGLRGTWALERRLPFELSDAAVIAAVIALWTRRPLACELAWFWGMTGALAALITPDLSHGFPHFFYWSYFIRHAGIVVAGALLVLGLGLFPRSGAVGRVYLLTAGFAALAGFASLLTGGNYMFLREKPSAASPLDLMGPWPWYIASGALLASMLFVALDAPFRRARARRTPVASA